MKKKTKVVSLVIIPIIIIAHLFGFKIFGSATLVQNHPLDNPVKLLDITKEGKVVLEFGSEHHIYGITTILPKPLEQIRYFKHQVPTLEVELESPENMTSKVWAKNRLNYFCGNTWMPQPLPPRLPAFSKVDLAEILVSYGGAIPDISVFEESPEYAKQLMKALSSRVSALEIEQNSESAIRLGEYLIASQPEYFREGAWLLALNNKSEIFDVASEKANEMIDGFEERKKKPGGYIGGTRKGIIDFAYILMKLSQDKAKQFLLGHIQSDIDVYLRMQMGTVLLSVDDYRGYDILMDEMMETGIDESVQATLNHAMDRFLSNSTPNQYFPYIQQQFHAGLLPLSMLTTFHSPIDAWEVRRICKRVSFQNPSHESILKFGKALWMSTKRKCNLLR